MHGICDSLNVGNRAENVAGVRARDQLRLVAEQRLQRLDGVLGVGGARRRVPPLDGEVALFRKRHPGRDVRFVVVLAEDELAAWGQVEDLGEVAEKLGR